MTNNVARKLIFIVVITVAALLSGSSSSNLRLAAAGQTSRLQPNTLCARDERIIFSCQVRNIVLDCRPKLNWNIRRSAPAPSRSFNICITFARASI